MNEGRIVNDEEIKEKIAAKQPYRKWLNENLVHLKDISAKKGPIKYDEVDLKKREVAFGYTKEDHKYHYPPDGSVRERTDWLYG